jgi:UDP-N-acetylglucosamine 2-epimerase
MKILSLVDSSTGFLHATVLSRALRRKYPETLVHAGPHSDFFQARSYLADIDLIEPDLNLELRLNSHSVSVGDLLNRLERVLIDVNPGLMVVRGDSSVTLAGALAAARHCIPVARLDAGTRVYAKRVPHELNRMLVDRLADIHFCSSNLAIQHLADEGIASGVHRSGDLGLDIVTQYLPLACQNSSALQRIGLCSGFYLLAVLQPTLPEASRLYTVVKALNTIREPIVFPMSFELRTALDRLNLTLASHVLAIDPLGYLDTLNLEAHARAIITDDDSVQRVAYHLAVPCITLGSDTEMRETVDAGWNCLVGHDPDQIVGAARNFLPSLEHPPLYGDGHAADYIAEVLASQPIAFGQNYDRAAVTQPAG